MKHKQPYRTTATLAVVIVAIAVLIGTTISTLKSNDTHFRIKSPLVEMSYESSR